MIPNTPNRYGELGVWIPPGEFDRMVTALRALVDHATMHIGVGHKGETLVVCGAQSCAENENCAWEQAREALWVLMGEEVGRRTSAPSGDRS